MLSFDRRDRSDSNSVVTKNAFSWGSLGWCTTYSNQAGPESMGTVWKGDSLGNSLGWARAHTAPRTQTSDRVMRVCLKGRAMYFCICQLKLAWSNSTDWMPYTTHVNFLRVLQTVEYKIKMQQGRCHSEAPYFSLWCPPPHLCPYDFPVVCSHRVGGEAKEKEGFLEFLLTKTPIIAAQGLTSWPHLTFTIPLLQIQPRWGLRRQHVNFGGDTYI